MKPISLDTLLLFVGAVGGLVLLAGCLLVLLYLLTAHRPQPGATRDAWD